ncbi:MAG: aldo/keto reductase [Sphingomonas sp.]
MIALPRLGFGTAPLGNLYREISEDDARATIDAAQQSGLTYADTAPHYGLGLAEKRLGAALQPGTIVSTKVGRVLLPAPGPFPPERNCFFTQEPFEPAYDYTHDGVLRSHEDSLARLGRDRIHILYVHDIGRVTHGDAHPAMLAQLFEGGGFRALLRLRDEGAIDAFGIGVNETEVAMEIIDRVQLDIILMAGRYTLLEQGALADFFPRCQAEDTAIVIGGPYNSGLLTGGGTYNYEAAPAPIVARARAIEAVCARHGVALGAAALQFPLAHPAVASVIPGLASIKEVQETVERSKVKIPADLWAELKAETLLAADAPVPLGVPA